MTSVLNIQYRISSHPHLLTTTNAIRNGNDACWSEDGERRMIHGFLAALLSWQHSRTWGREAEECLVIRTTHEPARVLRHATWIWPMGNNNGMAFAAEAFCGIRCASPARPSSSKCSGAAEKAGLREALLNVSRSSHCQVRCCKSRQVIAPERFFELHQTQCGCIMNQ